MEQQLNWEGKNNIERRCTINKGGKQREKSNYLGSDSRSIAGCIILKAKVSGWVDKRRHQKYKPPSQRQDQRQTWGLGRLCGHRLYL